MKIIGTNAVIPPARGICHENCHGDFLLHTTRLTRKPLKKPPASAAMMIVISPNADEIRPKCMIRVELDKLVVTSRPVLIVCFEEKFIILSPVELSWLMTKLFYTVSVFMSTD